MYEDYSTDDVVHPAFDEMDDLQIFDSGFEVDYPFKDLTDISVSFE